MAQSRSRKPRTSAKDSVTRSARADLNKVEESKRTEEQQKAAVEASKRMSLANPPEDETPDETVVNYTDVEVTEEESEGAGSEDRDASVVPETYDEDTVEVSPTVEAAAATEVVRIRESRMNLTIGAGTSYNFEAGRRYKVPANVARHLREKGYAYD